jgi:hypothetical protein
MAFVDDLFAGVFLAGALEESGLVVFFMGVLAYALTDKQLVFAGNYYVLSFGWRARSCLFQVLFRRLGEQAEPHPELLSVGAPKHYSVAG